MTPAELETVVRLFKRAIIERTLGGELTHHLGYAKDRPPPISPTWTVR
jgi:putative transposase